MSVSSERFHRLQHSLARALRQEWPQLNQTTAELKRLQSVPIGPAPERETQMAVIATVATDGGENRLNLEPMRLQIVRVADSLGRIYFEEFIAQSLAPAAILKQFKTDQNLQAIVGSLGVSWDDLLPETDYQRSHLLSMLRELMEWAALLNQAASSSRRLLLRDGLLRSVLLPERVFHRLVERFEALTFKQGHLLAGVAKKSSVINYLALGLDLNGIFARDEPAFVPIPAALEREVAPAQYRWIGSRSMGWLHVARLDQGQGTPLLPVDVASWQRDRARHIMALLRGSARGSFPLRGYPQALTAAHEHAKITGWEIELLESLLLEQIRRVSPEAARKALQLRLVGKRLVEDFNYGHEA